MLPSTIQLVPVGPREKLGLYSNLASMRQNEVTVGRAVWHSPAPLSFSSAALLCALRNRSLLCLPLSPSRDCTPLGGLHRAQSCCFPRVQDSTGRLSQPLLRADVCWGLCSALYRHLSVNPQGLHKGHTGGRHWGWEHRLKPGPLNLNPVLHSLAGRP